MHDRERIRELIAAGGTIRGTAREVGADRNAVRRATRPGARTKYSRAQLADRFEPAVRDVLADYPLLSVDEIGTLIDWPASRRTLSNIVARLRPEALERATEDLNVPSIGSIRIGTIATGTVRARDLRVGSADGHEVRDLRDPA